MKDQAFQNLSLQDLPDEEWRDILGYDGIYNISNYGRVKSIGRYVNSSNGRQRWVTEKILKQSIDKRYGDCQVKLSVENIGITHRIPTLVGDLFLRDRNKGEEICHNNKVKSDNRLINLVITTHSHSQLISYSRGVMSNWGIETVPKNEKCLYLKKYGIYEDGILIKKICTTCNNRLKLSEFYGNDRACKNCVMKGMGVKEIGKLRDRMILANNGYRYCSICKTLKSLETDFGNDKYGYLLKSNTCKSCVKKLNAKYRARMKLNK